MDLLAHARALLDKNSYLTLGTVGADGRPWTTPVWFAAADEREYFWLSATDTRHSRNLAARPAVSLVIFDSTVPPFHGRAVYAAGEAGEVSGDDLDRALTVYPAPRGRDGVTGDSPYRLYRATASEVWVLCPGDPDGVCELHNERKDHRARVH